MEVRHNRSTDPVTQVIRGIPSGDTPYDPLRGVVIYDHSISPKDWIQPVEKEPRKRYHEPSFCPLDSRTREQ